MEREIGNVFEFEGKTLRVIETENMTENGFEYVDLSLPSGTMWATCNVGANSQFDNGLLFQFGRVDGYRYGDKNNKFRTHKENNQDNGCGFIPITTSGKVYEENDILDLKDDAAHVNMGGRWKMPTKNQLDELFNHTTRKVETLNGVKGVLFKSKINGHQLFIPFDGYWTNGSFYDVGSYANLWSSQMHTSDIHSGYVLICGSYCNNYVDDCFRYDALSVRGVFNKE